MYVYKYYKLTYVYIYTHDVYALSLFLCRVFTHDVLAYIYIPDTARHAPGRKKKVTNEEIVVEMPLT